ncbi:MAG TPA: squalene/phytoene synthase family protein [Caulobacteraceae bacterium]|nr:squalene/phytoene synthase family protein [Caulobacteraceae bacterium]
MGSDSPPIGAEDLDAVVRRADPDRWLASRFISDPTVRADVIALYAFNHELARVGETVHEPLMGEIRLTWWREALDEIFAGRSVRRHPVAEALEAAVRRRGLARAPLEALVEARFSDLEPDALALEPALEAYVDGTAGALMAVAVAVAAGVEAHGLRPAARAWGLAGLLRLRQAGVARLPERWTDATVRAAVDEAMAQARVAARTLPVSAFPCVAYVSLARPYAAGRALSDLEKRLRLTFSVLTGRL